MEISQGTSRNETMQVIFQALLISFHFKIYIDIIENAHDQGIRLKNTKLSLNVYSTIDQDNVFELHY